MKALLIILSWSLPLSITVGGCQQEEPSVESKLVGYWQSEEVIIDGQDAVNSVHIDFQTNEYRRVFEIGTWQLSEGKDSIVFVPDNTGGNSYAMRIVRLNEDELWLTRTVDSQLQEERYEKRMKE